MKPIFRSIDDKKPLFPERRPRRQVEPKLTIPKRITGEWPDVETCRARDPEKHEWIGFGRGGSREAA